MSLSVEVLVTGAALVIVASNVITVIFIRQSERRMRAAFTAVVVTQIDYLQTQLRREIQGRVRESAPGPRVAAAPEAATPAKLAPATPSRSKTEAGSRASGIPRRTLSAEEVGALQQSGRTPSQIASENNMSEEAVRFLIEVAERSRRSGGR